MSIFRRDVGKVRNNEIECFINIFEEIAFLKINTVIQTKPLSVFTCEREGIFGNIDCENLRLGKFLCQSEDDHSAAGANVEHAEISNSTSCSVSGRGMSARLSQRNVRPQNSTVPSKCWSGSPWPRRRTRSRRSANSASPRSRSNSR